MIISALSALTLVHTAQLLVKHKYTDGEKLTARFPWILAIQSLRSNPLLVTGFRLESKHVAMRLLKGGTVDIETELHCDKKPELALTLTPR